MNNEDLGQLRQFIDTALERGWTPCNQAIKGTSVVYDPPCIRVSVASSSLHVDNDIYMDWLSPLHERQLAQAVWGSKLLGVDHQEAWRYHQHKLLDLLQTAPTPAYFEYLGLTR